MSSQRWLYRFIATGVAWGSSFLLIKWGLESLSSVGVAFGRQFIGAVTLLIIAAATHARLPRSWSALGHIAVVAFLLNAFPAFLFAYAEQHVSSVMAGMLNATTALMTMLVISFAFREQRINRNQVLGVFIGFIGIVLVTGILEGTRESEWQGVLTLLLATLCYGISYPYSQRHLAGMDYSPLSISATQVGLAAMMLLPFALVDGTFNAPITGNAIVGMFILGAVGTGLAYVWNFQVVQMAGSAIASTVTYLTPIVATVLGVALLGEHVTVPQLLGGLLVLLSAALVQKRFQIFR